MMAGIPGCRWAFLCLADPADTECNEHGLLKSAIMRQEMIEKEQRGRAMLERGLGPSFSLSDAELDALHSGYVALAYDAGRGGKPSRPLMTMSLVVHAYRYAKGALAKDELDQAISAWWTPFNQLGLATQEDLGGSGKYDLSPYADEFLAAMAEQITSIVIRLDKQATVAFKRQSAAPTAAC